MSVTLAIPNYNGAQNLEKLLNQVINEDFELIFVLDDGSNDSSEEITKKFSTKVTFVKGSENKGAAGNRNRILQQRHSDILMFLDVDMTLLSENIVEKVTNMFSSNETAVIGGQIYTLKNEPMWWNYGYEMHPLRDAKADVVHEWVLSDWNNHDKITALKEKYSEITPNLEISFDEPTKKEVDWVSEANFCVRSSVFQKVEGFDEKMSYHADQDLCKRVKSLGYKIMFSPQIKSMHMEIDTYGESRPTIIRENSFYYYRKHWGLSREVFDLLYPVPEEKPPAHQNS